MNNNTSPETATHTNVMIVGAGLSGIGAAVHLQKSCPDRDYMLIERREAIGGTWDLFRYPGVRSDSDMHTLGYNFKPWKALWRRMRFQATKQPGQGWQACHINL